MDSDRAVGRNVHQTGTADGEPVADQHWLVRAVPGLFLAAGIVTMVIVIAIAERAGVTQRDQVTLDVGPVEVRVVFTAPSLRMIVAGVLTAMGVVLLVNGANTLAASRATQHARDVRESRRRPLRAEAVAQHRTEHPTVTALVPAHDEAINGVALAMLVDWLSEDEHPVTAKERVEAGALAQVMGNADRVMGRLALFPE
jgi:hypothetical protein